MKCQLIGETLQARDFDFLVDFKDFGFPDFDFPDSDFLGC